MKPISKGWVVLFVLPVTAHAGPPTTRPAEPEGVAALRLESVSLEPLLKSDWVREFVRSTRHLPHIAPRTIYIDKETRSAMTEVEYKKLPEDRRTKLTPEVLDETYYYTTRYGTPLAYARPLDILAARGLKSVAHKRILDFGYGTIGHLRLLAGMGAEMVGVEVDPRLTALYSEPGDTGSITVGAKKGSIKLIEGRFPTIANDVGDGYDLFISKNTLKNGFFHPERPTDKRRLIDVGVGEEEFVRTLYRILKPGGLAMIYNICPAPAPPDKPYIPWADGRCPFPKKMWETAGFRVIEFDRDDTTQVREMAHALGWDKGEGAMNLETDLFAHYTLLEKPAG